MAAKELHWVKLVSLVGMRVELADGRRGVITKQATDGDYRNQQLVWVKVDDCEQAAGSDDQPLLFENVK